MQIHQNLIHPTRLEGSGGDISIETNDHDQQDRVEAPEGTRRLSAFAATGARVILGSAIILAAWAIGMSINLYLQVSVPGPILGLLLMFAGILSSSRIYFAVAPAARILIKGLPFFFFPLGAGLLTLKGIPLNMFALAFLMFVVSLAICLAMCAFVFRMFSREGEQHG